MPKVLILGLYYPPANFMAGRRLEGWARYLPTFGYEPLVLTRYYDPGERNTNDFYASARPTRTLSAPWIEENGAVYTRFEPGLWSRLPLPGKVRGLGYYCWPDPDHAGWLKQCRDYLQRSDFLPDVIIGSHSPPGVLRVASKLSDWLGVPWVADFRDLWLDQSGDSVGGRFKRFFQRRLLKTAAGVTVVSDAMVDAVRRQLAPLEKPIRLIYNGADPPGNAQPDPADKQAVEEFENLRRDAMVLTYAGMLYPEQEVARFLEAVADYNRRGGRSCAVVLCGHHERATYASWPFVRVLGPLSHATAVHLIGRSTATFYPTWPGRYTGFSGKLFEQVVSGRPVLIAFQPSPDLEALSRRFESVVVMHEPEELIDLLGLLSSQDSTARAPVPEIATKRYWAGELAGFLDEILEHPAAAADAARESSVRVAG
jgi:glycosyltransferase involved in cell wall biosynthesis